MITSNDFMGYSINTNSLAEIIERCESTIDKQTSKLVFSCANPHSLAVAEKDYLFKQALFDADVLVTDGVGLSIVGSIFEVDVGPRITGGGFFSRLMSELDTAARQRPARVFFFGSSDKVLALIQKKLSVLYPNIECCGVCSPPFGNWSADENRSFIEKINAAKPDVLWVGMTAPKQELWTHQNRHDLQVPVIANVGAVFDFFAGTHKRAPRWATKLGVEWLFRLCREPRRMWRRNLISPAVFITSAYISSRFKFDSRARNS